MQSNFVFPWPETLAGAAHPSIDLSPEAQWDAVPVGAKWQIFAVISLLELWDECGGGGVLPHYTKGRQPGKYPSFQPFRDAVHPVFDLYGEHFARFNFALTTQCMFAKSVYSLICCDPFLVQIHLASTRICLRKPRRGV